MRKLLSLFFMGLCLLLVNCGSEPTMQIAALVANGSSVSSVLAGSSGFTLTVTGSGFKSGSVVRWNGSDRPTTYVSSSQLTATISAADIANPATVQITVVSGSKTTDPMQLLVNAPVPSATSIAPTSANAGGAAFTLTVNGAGFLSGSAVKWNGSNRPTTFVSGTKLTAAVTAVDVESAGTASVTVSNSGPGGGSSSAITFTINAANPAPTVSSLSPTSATAGGAAFTLTANGTGFVSSSVIQWDGSDRPTTFVSSTKLTAAITAADIASSGTASVTVSNPSPGGGSSTATTFTINAVNPAPTVSSLSPTNAIAGATAFTLTVNGTGFMSSSVVQWDGSDRPTTFVSSTKLTAAITAADIASSGTASVTVSNPSPGGGNSTATTFTINAVNPAPTVSSISPTNATAGGAAFTLTVNGTGFMSSSVVQWDGSDRPTTFVSGTKLTAAITAADIASSGTASVHVVNPIPGGGTSTGHTFTVDEPNLPPSITSLSSSTVNAGGAAYTLTVNGTNFVSGSIVRWNGSPRSTTFVSSTQLTASITAADIASPGTASVTVANPDSGVSNSLTVNIVTISAGVIARVSLANDGSQSSGNNSMGAEAIAANGRYVVFSSAESTFAPVEIGGREQIYLRDTCIDASGSCTPSTTMITFSRSGLGANVATSAASAVITPDARYIAYTSSASDLVSGDTNGSGDVLVRDTCVGAAAGCTPTTSLISLAIDGTQFVRDSGLPAISDNGRYVAFRTMVMPYPNDTYDVYLRDTCAGVASGCTPSTMLVGHINKNGSGPAISADGRYVAFDDFSTVKLFDSCIGAGSGCTQSTTVVSVDSNGVPLNTVNSGPIVSANGRYITWYNSHAGVPDYMGTIYLRDTCNGAPGPCTPSTIVASVANDGSASNEQGAQNYPSMTPDGRFVAFQANSSNLVAADTNNTDDLFVRDTCIGAPAGCVPSTVRVTLAYDGTQLSHSSMLLSGRYVITADGRYIVFDTVDAMVADDTNSRRDVFIARTGW